MLNRLELLGETLRATLNELAAVAPGWRREVAPEAWSERDARRIADGRLPRAAAEREADAHTVGADGVARLDRLGGPQTPEGLRQLPMVKVLRPVWARPFERKDAASRPRPNSHATSRHLAWQTESGHFGSLATTIRRHF